MAQRQTIVPDTELKMEVFVKFKALENKKTRITLLQNKFRDVEAKNNHETGWIGTLTCLDDYLN